MDIYNVNIYDITVKYIDYINKLKEMDLDIASEFIVIAATLIEIKSRSLLPKKLKVEEQEEEEDLQILFDRLVEYRKFKKFLNICCLSMYPKVMFILKSQK